MLWLVGLVIHKHDYKCEPVSPPTCAPCHIYFILYFYFIYSMYIFLAFFFTCQLMFMSILFCTFFHRNKHENWTRQRTLNHKCRRIHAKVHISTRVPYPIVFRLLCLYLLHWFATLFFFSLDTPYLPVH
jgi:hypothetical protein